MRLRLPELLESAGLTAYALAKQSHGRISLSTAYRLCRMEGRLDSFDAAALDALCDVLQVGPGELFEREIPKAPRASSAKERATASATRRRAR